MPFVSGLELAAFSLFEVATGAHSLGRIIEGPEHENKLTFPIASLLRSKATPFILEAEGPFIQEINASVRNGHPVLSRIGKETMRLHHRFQISKVSGTADALDQLVLGRMGETSFSAFIHPGQVPPGKGPKQFLIEMHGPQGPMAYMMLRHLHDGIATTTIVIGGIIVAGIGIAIGYWWGRNSHEEATLAEKNRHEEAMAGLKDCTYISTNGTTTVSGEGHAKGKDGAGGGGEYTHSSSSQIHRDVAPVGSGSR